MSFLSGIFKKKAGGTLFGNLLRGVAKTATNGILGNGANMIPAGSTTGLTNAQIASGMTSLPAGSPPWNPVTGSFSDSSGSAALNSVAASATASTPFDLNKIVTLPTVNLGTSSDSQMLIIAALAIGALVLFKKH